MNAGDIPDEDAHVQAAIAVLATAFGAIPVVEGDGTDATGAALTPPYVVVASTAGPPLFGPAGATHELGRLELQVSCIHEGHRGANALRRIAQQALLTQPLAVPDRRVHVSHELPVGVHPDRDVSERTIFVGIDRFRLFTAPA